MATTSVLDFYDVCPGFQSQDGLPDLYAFFPVCIEFLRFISGATPADLMAAESFSIHILAHIIKQLLGLESVIEHAAESWYVIEQTCYRMSHADSAKILITI